MLLDDKAYPSDWPIVLLDNVTKRGSGHTPSKSYPEYWNGNIKWVSLADTYRLDSGYIFDTNKKISLDGIKNSSAVIHPAETVILSRDAGVGKSAVTKEAMAVSQHFIAWDCSQKGKVSSWFLYYTLQFHQRELERQAVGSTIKTIGLPFFKSLEIPLPPLGEQKKIAAILSTWDRAIEVTEKLLANSQQQKKALMQQLLTGKKRLPGFTGEWTWKRAKELFQSTSIRNNAPDCELLSVTQENGVLPRAILERRVVMPDGHTMSYKLVQPGNFIISLRSFQGGLECSDYRGLVSPAYTVLENVVPTCKDFFRHYFKSYNFIANLSVATIGIRDGKQISYADFAFIKLPVPPIGEQKAIASALIKADEEITLLKSDLSRLRQEKKALMQQLLTGKRRVKIEADAG